MEPRLNVSTVATDGYNGLLRVEKFLRSSSLDSTILELVKLRASQINGCGYCVDMHAHDAAVAGETTERLFVVAAWRHAPYFTNAERAALELTEAATRLADSTDPVPDDIWRRATKHFDDHQLGALVIAIAAINAWNRIAVITHQIAGSHRR
ncbi:MAG: carboxymuconolactone decarboxylase family protein [Microthrixaceae bacterium]|nr:carboxymuconolactone decarboxylase family protein [Microthrixaceae bacterium]